VRWDDYDDEYFDLVFASAIMIHVPEDRRDHVYSHFRRLLKRDGVLFVSYKIGDHTLISEDGRYFAYYRDQQAAQNELEAHGFRVERLLISFNNKDCTLSLSGSNGRASTASRGRRAGPHARRGPPVMECNTRGGCCDDSPGRQDDGTPDSSLSLRPVRAVGRAGLSFGPASRPRSTWIKSSGP